MAKRNDGKYGEKIEGGSYGRKHEYPLRPHAKDCQYYMRTGTCDYGTNCKYNHPVRRANQGMAMKKEKESSVERTSDTESKRPRVPKFGDWDNGENVPFTICFEKARDNRKGGKIINPNDPQENADLFSNFDTLSQASSSRSRDPTGKQAARSAHERRMSREAEEFRQYAEPPSPYRHNAVPPSPYRQYAEPPSPYRKNAVPPSPYRQYTESPSPYRHFAESPSAYNSKIPGRGVAAPSPPWEEKSLHVVSQDTPGRSPIKPGTGVNNSPAKNASLPKFGEWNNSLPSGDGYTAVFERARDKKQSGDWTRARSEVPGTASPSPNIMQKQTVASPTLDKMPKQTKTSPSPSKPQKSSKVGCFPWCRA